MVEAKDVSPSKNKTLRVADVFVDFSFDVFEMLFNSRFVFTWEIQFNTCISGWWSAGMTNTMSDIPITSQIKFQLIILYRESNKSLRAQYPKKM